MSPDEKFQWINNQMQRQVLVVLRLNTTSVLPVPRTARGVNIDLVAKSCFLIYVLVFVP